MWRDGRVVRVLALAAAAAIIGSLLAVWLAPVAQPEAGGYAQKIFYYHVGAAVTMQLAFLVGFGASLLYLWRRADPLDCLAVSANEVGLLFCTMVLVTGPLWARPVWGTWWRWEPRLTTFLILWLSYVAYFLFRRQLGEGPRRARQAAVYNLLAFLNLPLVVLATRLWRPEDQLHPRHIGLPPAMLATLALSALALALLGAWLVIRRYQIGRLETELVTLAYRQEDA